MPEKGYNNALPEKSAPALPWEKTRQVTISTTKKYVRDMIADVSAKLDTEVPEINSMRLSNQIGDNALDHNDRKCRAARAILEKCVHRNWLTWTFTYRIEEVR